MTGSRSEADADSRTGTASADGRYTLTRLVGTGGMGEVWQARDTAADREVAIKIPRAGSGFDPGRWLAAEAHTVARLNHPHLVALLDRTVILDADGNETQGLVFEFVSGRSLSMWTDRPRPWRWIRAIATQTLDALAYAHGRGVVHRDLKPSNILLSGDPLEPTVHLLDFGIAAWSAPVRGGDELPSSVNLNPMGIPEAPGTRAYMAPEQLGGELGDIGPWSDIYSFGVVLAELLLGKLPFPGEEEDAMWAGRLSTRFSPPIQVLADLGIPLRRFLLRMLAPDPAQRFGWAADARRSLPSSMIHDLTTPAPAHELGPESTDVMLQVVRRPEDRDTDPDVGRHDAEIMPIVEGGSITLELAPAGEEEVHLPPSWAVDKPDAAAWNEGLDKVGGRRKEATVPAVSYALLSIRDAPLTGRDAVWKEAWQHLASVVETKKPALLILEGPGGRGKTRFARELAAVAEEVGVARSHHVRFRGDGSGAGALRRLLHRVLRVAELPEHLRGDRVRRVLAEAGYPPEADLVPRLIAMLSPRQHARGPELEEATTAIELFTVLCRRRPLLLWLEDIDRASDRALVTWLGQLFRADPELPVAVVATKRIDDEQEEADPAWVMLRANAGTKVVVMDPLPAEAIASVLRFTAGASTDLGMEIARWSKGDPRAAQQIARHLHETDRLRWHPEGYDLRGDTPSTAGHLKLDSILRARARDAVQSSDDAEATQTTLDLLSLVRERAHHGYLLQAARRLGVPSRRIEAALGPLVMGALVDVRDEGPRLAHTALAESIREGIDLVRRMEFHKAWAVVLEASSRGHGRAERLLEAAWNRAACGQDEIAARDELEAAHLLRDRWEVKAASRAADSARNRLIGKQGLLRPEEEADLQVLGSVLDFEVRSPAGSPSELAGALDMLQPLWVALPPSIERCRADLVHAEALRRAGRPTDARESLQRGLDGARAVGSTLWECRALTLLADSCRLEGDLGKADELAERAWALVQGLHDDTLTLSVLVARLPIGTAMGDVERTKLWLDKLRGHLRARASWQDLQNLWLFRGEVERISGRLDQARQAYQTALVLGRQRGLHNETILLNLAAMNLSAGDLDGARETLTEAGGDQGIASPHSHELRTGRAVLRAELGIRSGRADEASSALQDAEILQAQSPISQPILLESLQRSSEQELEPGMAARLEQLRTDMQARLKLGHRRRR